MLRIQMIGLAILAALAMSAVAAGSASAAHEWLINGAPIAAATKVHSQGLLLLTDHNPLGNASFETVIHCHGFDAGTVGPGAADLIESITAELLGTKDKITCAFDKAGGCKSTPAPVALAVNLPWKTELYLTATGEVRDMIVSDGAGEPGWKVECTSILGGAIEDVCKAPLGSVGLENMTEGVLGTFEAKSENANCSVNGETARLGAGLVRGPVLTENPGAGETLSFM